jgi:uncharacterized membrane protein YfcA
MTEFFALQHLADNSGYFALAIGAVIAAYAIFTLVGFGTAMMASPPLALVMPVGKVVPMLALLDFAGSSMRGWRTRQDVAWEEFSKIFPGMLLGQLAGVLVLSRMPSALMATVLGVFIALQGAKGFIKRPTQPRAVPQRAIAYGLFGGVLGGLFGSGGFVYASYLERRLESRVAFRATQAVLIALSTGWRIILCAWVGLLDVQVVVMAIAFVPAMCIGVFVGHHIDLRISREQLFLLLNGLLVASGISLIVRFLG